MNTPLILYGLMAIVLIGVMATIALFTDRFISRLDVIQGRVERIEQNLDAIRARIAPKGEP